jgi:hypothetical protein
MFLLFLNKCQEAFSKEVPKKSSKQILHESLGETNELGDVFINLLEKVRISGPVDPHQQGKDCHVS